MEKVDQILEDRGNQYGAFDNIAFTAQILKDCVRQTKSFDLLLSAEREAIDMIMHKIARIVNMPAQNIDHRVDQWVDVCGYGKKALEKVEEILHRTNKDQ